MAQSAQISYYGTLSVVVGIVTCQLIASGAQGTSKGSTPDFSCAVTIPNYLSPKGSFTSHRVGNLAVSLPPNGILEFTAGGPGFALPDGSLGFKFGWERLQPGALIIRGRRIDKDAPPLRARVPPGYQGNFQSSELVFSSPGCWEVTGTLVNKGTVLESMTFIIRVVKIGPGPAVEQNWQPTPEPTFTLEGPKDNQ